MTVESHYKKTLRRVYHTKFGQYLWRAFAAAINHPAARVLFDKAASEPLTKKNVPDGMVLLPKIECSENHQGNTVLLVVPFHGPDASSLYVDSICREFSENGYGIDAVVYSQSHWRPRSVLWDKTYYVDANTGPHRAEPGKHDADAKPSTNNIDDWSGDDLVQFIAALANIRKYKYCIVSYVFLSRALTVLPPEVYRIVITHDVFTSRNDRILGSTGSSKGFYFSVSAEQEKEGLDRADLVLAIRAQDENYFSQSLHLQNVVTLPYLPDKRPIPNIADFKKPSKVLRIGYLGSAHRPNVDAIKAFITCITGLSGCEIYVAGSVCGELAGLRFPGNVHIIGFVDNLETFYTNCDLVVNPDMLDSGLKIKCVEALAYGRPLVCTVAASMGLDPKSKYHMARSVEDMAEYIVSIINAPCLMEQLLADSIDLYKKYCNRYTDVLSIQDYERLANEKYKASQAGLTNDTEVSSEALKPIQ